MPEVPATLRQAEALYLAVVMRFNPDDAGLLEALGRFVDAEMERWILARCVAL